MPKIDGSTRSWTRRLILSVLLIDCKTTQLFLYGVLELAKRTVIVWSKTSLPFSGPPANVCV